MSAPASRAVSRADAVAGAASAAVFSIGASGLLGWHLGVSELIQPFPGYGSIKYNTAVGMALAGVGLGALLFRRRMLAYAASLLLGALAVLTLVQFLAGVDLGIDQLVVRDPEPLLFPGRPAANTALSLLCVALGLLFAARPPRRRWAALTGMLASLTLSIVVAAFLGFAAGIESAYTWLGLGQMAPNTAAGLGLAAVGLFRFGWAEVGVRPRGPSWLPSACLIGGITLSLILAESLLQSERSQNQRTDHFHAVTVAREVRSGLESPMRALSRMAERWALAGKPSREHFESEARINLRDFPGLEAVEWVDPQGDVAWAVQAGRLAQGVTFGLPPPPESVREASGTNLPTAAFPAARRRMDPLFQLLVPIQEGGRPAGFLVGLLDANVLFSDLVEALAPGYAVAVFADAEPVFERAERQYDFAVAEASFPSVGRRWRVRVEPGPEAEGRIRSGLPEATLLGGVGLSSLLALSVWLAQRSAERELGAVVANRRMEHLWNSGVVGILDVRRDGSVSQANDEMLRILGYERGDITSGVLRLDGLTPPEHRAGDVRALEELNLSDFAAPWRKELFRKDGSRVPVLTGIAIVEPETRDSIAVVIDETDRQRAEEAAARLASIVESSEDAIASIALDRTVTSWNRGSTRLYGYTAEEMLGSRVDVLFPPDQGDAARDVIERVMQGAHLTDFDSVRLRKDGTRIEVSMTLSPLRDAAGNITGASAIARDVTRRRHAEEELRQAKEAAESGDRAKSEFVANISHELRTPLNGILGMLDLCLGTQLDDEQLRQVETAHLAAEALLGIVNDLLDLSKIEAGRLDIDAVEFDLRDSLRHIMRSLELSARQKGLEFSRYVAADVPSLVTGDPGRIRQILVNLVGNAIKFTERGEVSVACSVVSRSDESALVRMAVDDTGIGIPADKQREIFEPFTQADTSTTRRFGGTGLGLAISRHLVDKMGGRLDLESKPGRGSRFTFELPLRVVRWENTSVVAALPGAIRGLRVLVADHDPAVRSEIEGWLGAWQMRAESVESASQALSSVDSALAEGDPFRLVLIDAELPGTDGFSLACSIRARSGSAETTLLILTRGGSLGDAQRCADLGVRAYLRKPIDSSSCLEAILQNLGDPPIAGTRARLVTRHSLREQMGWMRILLVEDNAFNEAVAVQLLERQGVIVSVARNGAEAVEAVLAGRFDLVLMDVQMPVMDGLTATRAIRAAEAGTERHVPVVAMTARAMTGDRQACLDAGMDGYLPKPIDPKELTRTLERLGVARVSRGDALPQGPDAAAAPCLPLDRAAVLAMVGGDAERLARLLDLFEEQAAQLLLDLREAVAAADGDAVRFAAHALKGSIGHWTTGLPYELARALEEGPAGGTKDLVASLQAEVTRLERALRDLERSLVPGSRSQEKV